jgi:hypothetical protein
MKLARSAARRLRIPNLGSRSGESNHRTPLTRGSPVDSVSRATVPPIKRKLPLSFIKSSGTAGHGAAVWRAVISKYTGRKRRPHPKG